MTAAWLYDGVDARRKRGDVVVTGAQVLVALDGGAGDRVDPALLMFVEDRGDAFVYGRRDRDGWRLGVSKPVDPALAALLPRPARYGTWIDRVGLVRASLIGGAISAVIVFAVYRLPHWLAPYVPDSVMTAYGDALVGDFGGKFCAGPGGQEALDSLTRRLAPNAKGLNVRVVNLPIVNAAALPGGNIVIFEELLSQASSAEEFAGVLGHEIAHVENRDVAEAMVRELGLGLVVSTLGGDVGGNAHLLLSMRYGREAEARADAASIAAMRRAGISPAPTAKFFDRLARDEAAIGADSDVFVYLSTHPDTRERAVAFRKAAEGGRFTPALARVQWDALVDICHNDPKQRDWSERTAIEDRIRDTIEGRR